MDGSQNKSKSKSVDVRTDYGSLGTPKRERSKTDVVSKSGSESDFPPITEYHPDPDGDLTEALQEFADNYEYHSTSADFELTPRVVVLGAFFAIVNATANMVFAFRYAGGLAQYWVIILAYPLGRLTELLPQNSWFNPAPFNAKEHCLVMTIAIAAALAGSLGLAGGMTALFLDFQTPMQPGTVSVWATLSGFFGLFFGNCFFKLLVLPDCYEWPLNKMNAVFIASFHSGRASAIAKACTLSPRLKVFFTFFVVALCWFIVPNYFLPVLLTMSVLCWTGTTYGPVEPFGRSGLKDIRGVLGSGYAGGGFPGIGGWLSVWGYSPTIIPLNTTVWMAIGCVLGYWVFVPTAFFSGLVAWPGSFDEYNIKGEFYNQTEGHFDSTNDGVYISGVGMLMYIGVSLSIVGALVESSLKLLEDLPCCRSCRHRVWRGLKVRFEDDEADANSLGTGTRCSKASLVPTDMQVERNAALDIQSVESPAKSARSEGTSLSSSPPMRVVATDRPPLPLWANLVAVGCMSVGVVLVVRFMFPTDPRSGEPGLGTPWWAMLLILAYTFVTSFGCCYIMAKIAQSFGGGVCILLQVLVGFMLPKHARANIVAVMLCNTITSQTLTILGDYKTALFLRVKPWKMFVAQLIGTSIGVMISVGMFFVVLDLDETKKINLGSGQWPAIGAVSQGLNAKIFGEQGPASILHGPLLTIVVICCVFAVVGCLLLWMIPDDRAWKKWLPSPVYLGVGGLYGGVNYTCISWLCLAILYQYVLKKWRRDWYSKYQYISTAGVMAGIGICGLVLVVITFLGLAQLQVGPQATNTTLVMPPQTYEEAVAWNQQDGCNTPWPSN